MNKKGFTLVELLAVIAILAILVIIALPNVLKLYNDARKNAFLTETKSIYSSVSGKYFTSNLNGNKLSYINSKNNTKLDLSGEDLDYCINLNNNGTVKTMIVKNDNYYVEYNDSEDITTYTKDNVKESTERTKLICSKSNTKIIESPKPKECTSGKTLTNGTTYEDGTYTYTYNNKSWSVVLTDKESESPVTEVPCSVIDNYPLTSTEDMFFQSKAVSIDVSNFDTSNVTKMGEMFLENKTTNIIGLEYLNTSKVTSMFRMFSLSQALTLELSGFDTSNVTNMWGMFSSSQVTDLDLSSFNTSKVTNMGGMFSASEATEINGLESFDTSNVTTMIIMFSYSNCEVLDISNFDTSNVTNMDSMFFYSQITEIKGLENFNTSKVANMNAMFSRSKVTNIDLSNFDTSNVTTMKGMFYYSKATEIKGLENFNTSKVTNMVDMFGHSQVKLLNLSGFDMSNVTDTSRMFEGSKATVGYARTQTDADKLNNSSNKPSTLVFVVK